MNKYSNSWNNMQYCNNIYFTYIHFLAYNEIMNCGIIYVDIIKVSLYNFFIF